MQVVIVSHFYAPEPAAAANRVGALARAFARAGHDVTVLTGLPSFPAGTIDRAYAGRAPMTETIEGIRIERARTYATDRAVPGKRLWNWLSVTLGVTLRLLDPRRRIDLLVVSSPPITLALPAVVGRLAHGASLVFDVRDVWPDMAIAIGRWREGTLLTRACRFVADTAYRVADRVVAVTEPAREEIVARGIAPDKVLLMPNGVDRVATAPSSPLVRRPGDAVVAFVGNMGLANGMDVVVDAAERLRDDPRVRIVLVGGGADLGRVRARVEAAGLRNVEFLGVLPRPVAQRVLADSDACLVPLVATLQDSVPSKVFDAFAIGCPVVLSADGEARRLVERSGAGIAAPAGDGAALAAAIRAVVDDPSGRARMAEAGRAFVGERYDRARIMDEYVAAVTGAAAPVEAPSLAVAAEPAPGRAS